MTLSAYFEDINAVRMDDDEEEGEDGKIQAYVFAKSGDGYRLMIQKSVSSDMTDDIDNFKTMP